MSSDRYDKLSFAVVSGVVVMVLLTLVYFVGVAPTHPGAVPTAAPPVLAAPEEHGAEERENEAEGQTETGGEGEGESHE